MAETALRDFLDEPSAGFIGSTASHEALAAGAIILREPYGMGDEGSPVSPDQTS